MDVALRWEPAYVLLVPHTLLFRPRIQENGALPHAIEEELLYLRLDDRSTIVEPPTKHLVAESLSYEHLKVKSRLLYLLRKCISLIKLV